jgi:hypothetical protein
MNPAKLLLILGGGYLLLRATGFKMPSLPGFDSGSPATPPATLPTGEVTQTPPPAPTPPPPISSGERMAIIKAAAAGDEAAAARSRQLQIMLGADAWNFYRTQETGVETTADLFTEGNRGELIDGVEYLRRRQAAGLSGVFGW